jgi:hypothetical protein
MQWQARPEGPSGEALLSGGWWRFLAAPHMYYDHRRPASGQAVAAGSSARGIPASYAHTGSKSGGTGSNSGDGAAHAGTYTARADSTSGCDFSHQQDAGDRLALREAPLWVRQRVAAMDRDPDAPKVGWCAMQPSASSTQQPPLMT